jgi:hypothetical protein
MNSKNFKKFFIKKILIIVNVKYPLHYKKRKEKSTKKEKKKIFLIINIYYIYYI